MTRRRVLTSVLLVASIANGIAGIFVVVVRTRSSPAPIEIGARFRSALARHDYAAAYALTDLRYIQVPASSSAITRAHFAAYEQHHPSTTAPAVQGLIHIATTEIAITAPDGPLPSLSVDGVPVPIHAGRAAGRGVGTWRYRYPVLVISGPHRIAVGSGPVTAPAVFVLSARGHSVARTIDLSASAEGEGRAVAAMRAIVGTCPGDSCVVGRCSGSGTEYVLDAWGIGTPPVVARALVGDRVIAPMPPDGWSIAITFVDQGQPPGLSGHEQTRSLRARYVFGFVGRGRARLLDKCWIAAT